MEREQELIKVYIGNKYDEIVNRKFSIYACLFGGFYFVYRRMKTFGMLAIMIDVILLNLYSTIMGPEFLSLALISLHLAYGLLFTSSYKSNVKKKVRHILESDIEVSKQEELVIKKGKTKVSNIILFAIFSIIITVSANLYLTPSNMDIKEPKPQMEVHYVDDSNDKEKNYINGKYKIKIISYEAIVKVKIINIATSEEFDLDAFYNVDGDKIIDKNEEIEISILENDQIEFKIINEPESELNGLYEELKEVKE